MNHPQILIVESDGRLADLLRPLADQERWSIREPRQSEACIRLLRQGGPGVLVLKLGRDLVRELELLDQLATVCPETGRVVVCDANHYQLAGLAWDLGANCVLFLPQPPDRLGEVVRNLMHPVREKIPHAST